MSTTKQMSPFKARRAAAEAAKAADPATPYVPEDDPSPTVPVVYEEPAPLFAAVRDAAAANAAPPEFLMPFTPPTWENGWGSWAIGAGIYVLGGLASIAYFLIVLGLWAALHVAMWFVGHPYRLVAGAVISGVLYLYTTHK